MKTLLSMNIKNLRKKKNMTLEELAEKVGTSKQTIQRYESGKISNIPSDKIELLAKYLDTTPGSVSVLGLMNDSEKKVQLLIDEDVMKEPYFGCHPCINTSSLKFTTEDLMQKIIPALEHEPVTVTLPVPE